MNYVFGDGKGNFDNNNGLDYRTAVESKMTLETWREGAPERQVLKTHFLTLLGS